MDSEAIASYFICMRLLPLGQVLKQVNVAASPNVVASAVDKDGTTGAGLKVVDVL